MSCFVCDERIFQSVAKVCFMYGIRQEERTTYPLTIKETNDFIDRIAEFNCRNVAERYREKQQEAFVEYFDELPLDKRISVQDIKYCDCWMYQTCDYFDSDPLFQQVKVATDWAKSVTKYSRAEYEEANWG